MRFVETPRDMRLFGAALVATTIWRRAVFALSC